MTNVRAFASRHRFELLALGIAILLARLHWWADVTPPEAEAGAGPTDALLRGVHVLEGRATDVQFLARGPRKPHPDLVVVAVDEASAQRYGLWPWPRDLMARGLDRLHEAGVAAVGMDAVFTDEASPGRVAALREALLQLDRALPVRPEAGTALAAYRQRLEQESSVDPDEALAAAFARAPEVVQGVVVYGEEDRGSFSAQKEAEWGELLVPHMLQLAGKVPGSLAQGVPVRSVPSWKGRSAQMPLSKFATRSKRVGFFNATPDSDGPLRRVPIFARLDSPEGFLPSLELQTAATYLDATVEPVWDADVEKLAGARLRRTGGSSAPGVFVPLPPTEPMALINHVGPASVFRTVSLADVVDGKVDPASLHGKAVLFGVTLIGNYDQRVTPFEESTPGVYVHASYLSNILSGDFLTRPVEARLVEVLFMLVSALLVARLLPRVNYVLKLGTLLALAGGWVVVDQLMFARGTQLATVLPVMNVLASGFGVIFLGYLSVDREKGVLRDAFQHYLNPSVMDQMLAHPEKLKLGGEKKEMTVLFSDIRGFTTLSERMAPEALVKFINAYLTPMTNIVFEEGGTLDKYIGDALMAFWGAPIDQDDHALRACRTACRMLDMLQTLKAGWKDQNLPDIDIGVGINSGQMIVGNMGSDVRFDYTVMGDAVNLASRLEGTNKEYETRVLISEGTHALVRGKVVARRLGAVRVKGKRRPVRIYELRGMGAAEGAEAEAIQHFEAAVDLFAQQQWDEATVHFEHVLQLWPEDPPSRRYLEEIDTFRARPPAPGWDGVYTATSK